MSPAQVVRQAKAVGVRVISVADHDTVGGVSEAQAEGTTQGVEVIPGLELSTKHEPDKGFAHIHVLGYFIDHRHPTLQEVLDRVAQARTEQKIEQIRALQREGIDCPIEEVLALASGVPGRPHIAEVVMRRNPGRFTSKQELFTQYMTSGSRTYVPRRFSLTVNQAVEVIKAAGGLPVLAHPGAYDRAQNVEATVRQACAEGVQGLEVAYPYDKNQPHRGAGHSQVQAMMARFEALADALGLAKTGGSDFHGDTKDIAMGEMGMSYQAFLLLKRFHDG